MADRPRKPPRWMSNILPLNLLENPASGRGEYTTLSVLEPVIRIERTGDGESDSPEDPNESFYRVVVTFVLEVEIIGYNQGFQKHPRFFDSVSVRYLFHKGQFINIYPKPANITSDIQVTNETDELNELQAGLQSSAASAVAPTFSVHAQRDFKLGYQRTMNSWRMGTSFEPYPPEELPAQVPFFVALTHRSIREQHPFFQVTSRHIHDCRCQRGSLLLHHHHSCPLQRRIHYNRSAHWFWQREASINIWSPEVYGSFSCPITVTRLINVDDVDRLTRTAEMEPYLHFDFEIQTQIRELGWGWNFFKRKSKPAELRFQSDSGQQLPMDSFSFCVTCCVEKINWPRYQTRNLQLEAENELLRPGRGNRKLRTNAEFKQYLQTQKEERRKVAGIPTRTTSTTTKQNKTTTGQGTAGGSSDHYSAPPNEGAANIGRGRQLARSDSPGSDSEVEMSPERSWRTFVPGVGIVRTAMGAAASSAAGRAPSRAPPPPGVRAVSRGGPEPEVVVVAGPSGLGAGAGGRYYPDRRSGGSVRGRKEYVVRSAGEEDLRLPRMDKGDTIVVEEEIVRRRRSGRDRDRDRDGDGDNPRRRERRHGVVSSGRGPPLASDRVRGGGGGGGGGGGSRDFEMRRYGGRERRARSVAESGSGSGSYIRRRAGSLSPSPERRRLRKRAPGSPPRR